MTTYYTNNGHGIYGSRYGYTPVDEATLAAQFSPWGEGKQYATFDDYAKAQGYVQQGATPAWQNSIGQQTQNWTAPTYVGTSGSALMNDPSVTYAEFYNNRYGKPQSTAATRSGVNPLVGNSQALGQSIMAGLK